MMIKIVSILMSTYNGEKYIKEQLDSIINQEGDFKIEILVRDDGSTDKTTEILDEYQVKGYLRWYSGDNVGPAKSFIDLIKNSEQSDFYAFADQDDLWERDKLKAAIEIIEKQENVKPILYVGNALVVDSELATLGRNVYKIKPKTDFNTLVCAGGLLGCTFVMNDNLIEIVKKLNVSGEIVMHDFYVALVCSLFGGEIVFDMVPRLKYRQHGGNVVGVSYGLMSKIRDRLIDITTKPKVSIATQAETLLKDVDTAMLSDNGQLLFYKSKAEHFDTDMIWLKNVSEINKSFIKRLKLACSTKTKYSSKNMAFKMRASVLLGNR